MIKVTVGNNLKRETVIVDSATTLRDCLEDAGVDYSRTITTLDGATLGAGDLDKTFDDFGIRDRAYLLGVVKQDNA